jgi:beta-lactamase class A
VPTCTKTVDPEEGIRCRYHQWRELHSASVIKVITLCALLYQLRGRENLSPYQADLAQAMITESDNDAQDTLWNEIGMTALQHFLTEAGMNHPVLGTDDYWGLTEVNAHDELRLLQLLITRSTVLDAASRRYALATVSALTRDMLRVWEGDVGRGSAELVGERRPEGGPCWRRPRAKQ